jgi:hypothetical protein
MTPQLNIMGYVDRSEVNGFGRRAVVWLRAANVNVLTALIPHLGFWEPINLFRWRTQ